MNIATTLNVRRETLERFDDACRESGIKRRDLVSSLVNFAAGKMKGRYAAWHGVRYQACGGGWKRMHVALRGDEYEFFIDQRKVLKLSVSYIFGYAVEHYLDELLELMKCRCDNYQYRNYAIMNISIDNVSCWLLCWGIPPEIPFTIS
jgi:hypothetical protein